MIGNRVRIQEPDTDHSAEELPSAEELIASIPFVQVEGSLEALDVQSEVTHRKIGDLVSATYQKTKDLISAAICGIGIHSGVWSYLDIDYEEKCLQGRTCRRCDGDSFRVRHQIVVRALRIEKCEFVRVCDRCNSTDGEFEDHQWGRWNSESWFSSQESRGCRRCGASESRYKDND